MALHYWNGPQQQIGQAGVVADAMTVTSFSDTRAEGTFAFVDYVEHGIRGEETWEAERRFDEEGSTWVVKCTSDTPWQKDGEKFFTISISIDRAICEFISEKLEIIRNGGTLSQPISPRVGKIDPYKGPCVCEKLEMQNRGGEISWMTLTEGRSCPDRVHRCHCGRMWWNYDEEGNNSWAEIAEEALWENIIANNGKPSLYYGVLGKKLYLVQTLRDQGFIPIG